ncbi:MAG: hypothetical protein HFF17_01495 [Oscillospiraceae bacterium]|nr:hypothetical protein [Oscillospiraceae bacterium]
MGALSRQPIRMFLDLKAQLEENRRNKAHVPEVPETGMAVLRQQFALAETIEAWIAELKKRFQRLPSRQTNRAARTGREREKRRLHSGLAVV